MNRYFSKRLFSMLFTNTHEYLKVTKGKTARIGISHHAKDELGEIIFVDLNAVKVGEVVEEGAEIASLESVKAAASVYAPISCKLLKKNDDALKEINIDSESSGWLWEVELKEESDKEKLLDLDSYKKLL